MEQNHKALVNRYYEGVLNGRNEEALAGLLAPGFRSHFGDHEVDAAGYAQAVHRSLEAFADLRVEVLCQVAEGDWVATRWVATGTFPDGSAVRVSAMHFHRIEAGLLAEHWEELDPRRLGPK